MRKVSPRDLLGYKKKKTEIKIKKTAGSLGNIEEKKREEPSERKNRGGKLKRQHPMKSSLFIQCNDLLSAYICNTLGRCYYA